MLMASLLLLAPALVHSTSSAASAANGATIVDSWKDAKGRTIILREGTYNGKKGFGWTKITRRHAIRSLKTLRFISRNPNGGEQQGTARRYEAYANRQECKNGYCHYTDSLLVTLIVDFKQVKDYYDVNVNGVLGVQTAYCVNDNRELDCPSWVDQALGK
ncbi:hypothetical protein MXD59_18775 [Frankia sp. Ag45/Mut15]|uniref:Secreted protein n=2 Tax=Frankia umida TaxID=573489 RepID=A0ABT0K2P3_9ACTN|nr:hypothetical protein [Frankia umida]